MDVLLEDLVGFQSELKVHVGYFMQHHVICLPTGDYCIAFLKMTQLHSPQLPSPTSNIATASHLPVVCLLNLLFSRHS